MPGQTDQIAGGVVGCTGCLDHLKLALAQACGRITPVWDIKAFIAANSLRGFESDQFSEAVLAARAYFHADALMPLSFYRDQFRAGRITTEDVLAELHTHASEIRVKVDDLFTSSLAEAPLPEVLTLAERIDRARNTHYEVLIQKELTKWCAAYFDQGQATWAMPGRDRRFYTAWREAAQFDGACWLAGIGAFRQVVAELPATPEKAIETLVEKLGVTPDDLADYLTRLLTRLPGWSGYAQFRTEHPIQGTGDGTGDLRDLIAIGLAYEWALICSLKLRTGGISPWETIRNQQEPLSDDAATEGFPTELNVRLIWQSAFERHFRLSLLDKLGRSTPEKSVSQRPSAQAVFCIDVRSETLRRHLEAQGDYQTLGFAGFFGFPVAHRAAKDERTTARCPGLLRPKYTVDEAPVAQITPWADSRDRLQRSLKGALATIKTSAVSSYFHVETLGLMFGGGALLRTMIPGALKRIGQAVQSIIGRTDTRPSINPEPHTGGQDHASCCGADHGIPLEDQATIARNALTIMGLTENFGRIVLLCGHGSTSENNPYAAALDCGACGGHEGGTNARVAAQVFNRPAVREKLAGWGIQIPDDTQFVAARHNTTTDEVVILDEDLVPASHSADLTALKAALAVAGEAAQRERDARFGGHSLPSAKTRAQNWSEVRPEWGLAGNAAFIVAPRELTAGKNLEGRAFLHSYDWRADREGTALEVILTAPLVVAEWINMQYFLSTVDNTHFGSGNKVIHNVVGKLGVMKGNQSDLAIGLPLQSVSDGQRLVHEPLRLTAVVHAPRGRIDAILRKHDSVRRLVDHEWITLVALDPFENDYYRYSPGGEWIREQSTRL